MTWITVATMAITLISAIFTGNGEVSDAQAESLNAVSPGLGTLFQTAVGASNGLAPSYVEWAADTTVLKSLGLLSPWGSVGGILGNVTGFLSKVNPVLLIAGAYIVWKLVFSKGGGPNLRFWKSNETSVDDYVDEGEYL